MAHGDNRVCRAKAQPSARREGKEGPMPKASKELLDALNDGLSEELASVIQYMWQHVTATGMESAAIAGVFKEISMVEMDHAYKVAERIDLLGGVPTTAVGPVKLGGNLRQMLEDDLKAEEDTVELYRSLVKLARKEDDPVTLRLVEEILGETEEHAHKLATILEKA
jgi:bacterioferritin